MSNEFIARKGLIIGNVSSGTTETEILVKDSNGLVKLYLDGVLSNTATLNASIATSINYRIGTDVNSTAEPFSGNLYSIRVYNRDLSLNEILHNYNIQKTKFGL